LLLDIRCDTAWVQNIGRAKTCDVIKTSNASNMGLDLKDGIGLK